MSLDVMPGLRFYHVPRTKTVSFVFHTDAEALEFYETFKLADIEQSEITISFQTPQLPTKEHPACRQPQPKR